MQQSSLNKAKKSGMQENRKKLTQRNTTQNPDSGDNGPRTELTGDINAQD